MNYEDTTRKINYVVFCVLYFLKGFWFFVYDPPDLS